MQIVSLNPEQETKKIIEFLNKTLNQSPFQKVVIGISGGIDSAVSFFLAVKAFGKNNVLAVHIPYFKETQEDFDTLVNTVDLPKKNKFIIPINSLVDFTTQILDVENDLVRKGNIMARMRMITLFDLAKREKALVLGTENKSEHLLGYFTRFGDQASDIEPIVHLYKTQVYQLAKYLGIPQNIIKKTPSANLWDNQTDEKEFGFSYEEADEVLYLYFEKNQSFNKISKQYPHAQKIIERVEKNKFKYEVPYSLT